MDTHEPTVPKGRPITPEEPRRCRRSWPASSSVGSAAHYFFHTRQLISIALGRARPPASTAPSSAPAPAA